MASKALQRSLTIAAGGVLLIALTLGCAAEPRSGEREATWGLAGVVLPNAEWRLIDSDDALLVRRYYRTSLLGELKLYYGGEGLQTETQIRNAGEEQDFLLEAADILREQIELSGNQVRLENLEPRLLTDPYLAAEYSYHDRTAGHDQFHLERLYFVGSRYWFLDAGCLAEEEEELRPELLAVLDSLDFGEDQFPDRLTTPLDEDFETPSEQELESMEEFSGDWNL